MATLDESLVSSSARRLNLRRRPDLAARLHRYQGRSYWVVKEPVGLNYFRFQEQEFAILQMLDGSLSLDQIKEEFEKQFPPEKITVEELQHFIGTLHRSGLLVADVAGQGHQLKKRRDERRRKELFAALTNILSIRFKGIDPDRFLTRTLPLVRWMFSPVAVTLSLLLGLSALAPVAVEFDVFRAKLPTFHDFFTPANAIWLGVALAVTKVLHEFGHGYSCKYFGGECHELGAMILVLTPCLYCNVSDSWMLPNKWHRAIIGAAGMYVEVIIASICTFVWWFTEPGLLHNLALSTMFVCSVSTLLFNGNPLLRYDGYYILSDIAEIPNLRQKASDILNRKLGEWCLGLEPPYDPFLPQRNQWMFAVYSVAAAVYRWVVVFSILWFLYKMWEPYRLEIIGQMIALASVYGLVAMPLWKLGKFFYVPGRLDKVKKPRFYGSLAVVGLLLAVVLFLPLPYRIYCPLEVQPYRAASVYVEVPGQLEERWVSRGDRVEAGAPLARLKNSEARLTVATLVGQEQQYLKQAAALRDRAIDDPSALLRENEVQESLKSVRKQLIEKREEVERLELVAPVAGTILPPPEVAEPAADADELPSWSGTPLDRSNLGCTLEVGTMFCQIGDPARMQAVLVIDQADTGFVKRGQRVQMVLDARPGEFLDGQVEEIANTKLRQTSKGMSNKFGGEVATETNAQGEEEPISPSYQVRVLLNDPDALLFNGLRGRAKIYAGRQTLGQQAWRYLAQTFNFKL
ncbi:MAG: HlyD family efflux transporter periplasmic adaptor subunit [Pirellulales bacterium]|nr:HlyD family efflux transporter periplasmic adaptor subunit [Pirellulales bacterium]